MTDEIKHPVKEGQHYEHKRGSIYTISFLNDDVVLLYDGWNYRLEDRIYFLKELVEGMYELRPKLKISNSKDRIPLEEIDGVGETTLKSLSKKGLLSPHHFDHVIDENILELDGVGEVVLQNIRDWIDENTKPETIEI